MFSRLTNISLALILPCLSLTACGDDGVALDELGDKLANSICDAQVACGEYPDKKTCLAAGGDTALPQQEESVSSGRADYNADKVGACLEEVADFFNCMVGFPQSLELTACNEVFTGNVALGGECFDDEECAGRAECTQECGEAACCSGMCTATPGDGTRSEIGGPCSDTQACVDTARCDPETNLCAARFAEGAACSGFGVCEPGLSCSAPFGEGVCVRPAATGETCDSSLGFFACNRSDNWCDTATDKCARKPAAGDPCNANNDCLGYAYCAQGTCTARPVDGEACEVDGEASCLGNLECQSGTCAQPTPDPACGPAS